MPKLTKRFADGLDIRKTDYIVFDSDVGGFAVRVFPSGRKSYLIQYRNDGRTRRLAIGRHGTVATDEARKVALRRLGEVPRGKTLRRPVTSVYAPQAWQRYANGFFPSTCKCIASQARCGIIEGWLETISNLGLAPSR